MEYTPSDSIYEIISLKIIMNTKCRMWHAVLSCFVYKNTVYIEFEWLMTLDTIFSFNSISFRIFQCKWKI